MRPLLTMLFPGVLALFTGCSSIESRAPLVDAGSGSSLASVGREIYVSNCADCHVVRSVADYTLAQWEVLLPQMQILAEADPEHQPLSPSEMAALRAYVQVYAQR